MAALARELRLDEPLLPWQTDRTRIADLAAVCAAACAAQAPGLMATLLAAMAHEHEGASGALHAEWRPLRELFVAAGSAASWLFNSLTGLTLDKTAIAANLSNLHAASGDDQGPAPPTVSWTGPLAAHDDLEKWRQHRLS
jgi:3-carboxy-cis,cis-muconate cycloisomerase